MGRKSDLGLDRPIESIILEVSINNRKWVVIGAYRPQSVPNKTFIDLAITRFDKISTYYDNILLVSDLNFDSLDNSKGSTLFDLCDILGFKNLINLPTCFMKNFTSSLVDVKLTNSPQYCFNVFSYGCEISNCHNMIGVMIRGNAPRVESQKITYRSFENFDETAFANVGRVPFHAAYVFDEVGDIYWVHERLLADVIGEHAPIKQRKAETKKPSYMNGELRRAIFKKRRITLTNERKKFKRGL